MNSSRLLIRHGLGVLNDRYPSYTTSISSPDLWLVTKFVNGDKSTFSLHDFCCCWSCLSSSILSAEKQAMYIISAERKVEASPYQSRRQVGQRFSSGKRPRLNRLSNFDKTQSVWSSCSPDFHTVNKHLACRLCWVVKIFMLWSSTG